MFSHSVPHIQCLSLSVPTEGILLSKLGRSADSTMFQTVNLLCYIFSVVPMLAGIWQIGTLDKRKRSSSFNYTNQRDAQDSINKRNSTGSMPTGMIPRCNLGTYSQTRWQPSSQLIITPMHRTHKCIRALLTLHIKTIKFPLCINHIRLWKMVGNIFMAPNNKLTHSSNISSINRILAKTTQSASVWTNIKLWTVWSGLYGSILSHW